MTFNIFNYFFTFIHLHLLKIFIYGYIYIIYIIYHKIKKLFINVRIR